MMVKTGSILSSKSENTWNNPVAEHLNRISDIGEYLLWNERAVSRQDHWPGTGHASLSGLLTCIFRVGSERLTKAKAKKASLQATKVYAMGRNSEPTERSWGKTEDWLPGNLVRRVLALLPTPTRF
jgi:hypothetical protein